MSTLRNRVQTLENHRAGRGRVLVVPFCQLEDGRAATAIEMGGGELVATQQESETREQFFGRAGAAFPPRDCVIWASEQDIEL